jgi:predicted dehydrogenase
MNTENPSLLPRRLFIKTLGQAAATASIISGPIAAFGQESAPKLAFAFLGVAHIHAPNYVRILGQRSDVRTKYVWDHDAARAQAAAAALGAKVADDVKTICADPEIKAVVVCSETDRHHDLVLAAAAAGKHVFAEKPLGISAKESYEMADALEKGHLLFNTGYFMRGGPPIRFLKQQVEQGAFGKITRVRGSNCHNGSLAHWFDTDWRWMADPKIAGVGAFGDLGTHSLDLLMWMFGPVDSVVSDIKVVTGHYGDCDESGEALLKFKNGITGTLAAGWVDLADPLTLMISGTEGSAWIDRGRLFFLSKKVEGADGGQPWTKLPAGLPEPMVQFIDAVAGRTSPNLVAPREAASRVSVMEAAYQSSKQNGWVKPE